MCVFWWGAATLDDGGQAQRLTSAQFASVMRFALSSSEVDSAFFDEKVMREAFMPQTHLSIEVCNTAYTLLPAPFSPALLLLSRCRASWHIAEEEVGRRTPLAGKVGTAQSEGDCGGAECTSERERRCPCRDKAFVHGLVIQGWGEVKRTDSLGGLDLSPRLTTWAGWELNSAQELVRRRRYVHGLHFTGGVVKGSGPAGAGTGSAQAKEVVEEADGEASDGGATPGDSTTPKRVLLDYSGVETAMEVARVPAGADREELLLFDLDVMLLPGATSWLGSHSSCQVAEMRIFEPRCVKNGFFWVYRRA